MPKKTSKKAARRPASRATKARPARAARRPASRGPITTKTGAPVPAYLASLDPATRADCERLHAWMAAATGDAGAMYGKAIVGYGTITIRYAGGREAPWMKMGFSPRKQALTLYGVLSAASPALLAKLGKHATGKGCLYVKRLADVDAGALEQIIHAAGAR
ncbi:MAG: DUF1801 domain-containing protein [Anaeromyxobacteraceae bacterium]